MISFSVTHSRVIQYYSEPYFFKDGLIYSRWERGEKARGKWMVASCQGLEVAAWLGLRDEAYGVMDDFGNLVKVA